MVLYRKMMGEESILVVKKCLIALPEDGFLIRKIWKNIIVDEDEICYYNCSGDMTHLHFYEKPKMSLKTACFKIVR